MQLPEEKKKQHYHIITALWELDKQFGEPENTDAYWSALVGEVDRLGEEFRSPLYDALAVAYLKVLEKRVMGR